MAKGRQSKRRQASPRVLAGAGAVVAAAIAAIVLGVALTGGGSPRALAGVAEVHRQLSGIPQDGTTLGSPSAPVTLVEYVDLQCPYCAEFERQVMPQLIDRYVRTGTLKVVARPIAFIGPDSTRGQAAVLAAARQDKLFDVMQLLYRNQGAENTGWLDEQLVERAAASVPGLDVAALLEARASVDGHARQLATLAVRDDVRGTPTILVGKTAASARPVPLRSTGDVAAVTAAVVRALG